MLKGIRGAIDVEKNEVEDILEATSKLLITMKELNKLTEEKITMIFFTATSDITAAFPAKAARDLGWNKVPMLCAQEMNVQGALESCIRILLLTHFPTQQKVKHVYLGKAKALRPDISL